MPEGAADTLQAAQLPKVAGAATRQAGRSEQHSHGAIVIHREDWFKQEQTLGNCIWPVLQMARVFLPSFRQTKATACTHCAESATQIVGRLAGSRMPAGYDHGQPAAEDEDLDALWDGAQ